MDGSGPIQSVNIALLEEHGSGPAQFANLAVIPLAGSGPAQFANALFTPPHGSGPIAWEVITYSPLRLLREEQVNAPLIAVLRGANMNSAADQPLTLGPTKYVIRRVVVTNASVSLTTAVGGIYTGAGKTGMVLVSAIQSYAALTAPTKFVEPSLQAVALANSFTSGTLFLSLTTPQGVAATADFYLFGDAVEG